MAGKPNLRTVGPDEAPPAKPAKPMTLEQAIERGTYLDILLAQRRQVVADIPGEKGPAKAALHRQLSILSEKIEEQKLRALEDGEGADDGNEDDAPEAWSDEAL